MSCVHWPVTMPVMELYRPQPEQECSTEGMVGTAAAPRVSKGGRGGQIRGIIKIRTSSRNNVLFFCFFPLGILW